MTEAHPPAPMPVPEPEPDRPTGALVRLGISSAALAAMVLMGKYVTLPSLSMCLFKIGTGLPCPGCGMTRSMTSLGRADVLSSLRFHPLGVILGVGTAAVALGALVRLVRGRDPVWALLQRYGAILAVGFMVALFAIWVARVFVYPPWSPDPIG